MDASAVTSKLKPEKLFIGGKPAECASGKKIDVINPATGELLTTVERGEAADVDRAVRAARQAFESGPWPKMNASERGKILWRIGELIDKHRDELALLECLNTGKTLKGAQRGDMKPASDIFYYYSG